VPSLIELLLTRKSNFSTWATTQSGRRRCKDHIRDVWESRI